MLTSGSETSTSRYMGLKVSSLILLVNYYLFENGKQNDNAISALRNPDPTEDTFFG